MIYKDIETTYLTHGCIADRVIDWATEQGYKAYYHHFVLIIEMNNQRYSMVNFKVCNDGMILIDLQSNRG